MKVLVYLQRRWVEYGMDILFDGLCRVLGPENVLEYPQKPSFHLKRQTLGRYPCMFNYPVFKTPEQKLEMLRNDEFDFIIVNVFIEELGKEKNKWLKGEFWELVKEKSKKIPTFIVDQGDRPGTREDVVKDVNCRGYFKREYYGEENMIPLSYSFFLEDLPDVEKDIPWFWAGMPNSYRIDFLNAVDANMEDLTPQEYKDTMRRTRIGLNLRGFGHDTARRYEIPAYKALLLTQRFPTIIENDFVDGETAVYFDTPEELKDKLDYLLANPDYTDKIRLAGHEWFKKYHTNVVRARQFLRRINESL